MLVDVLTLPSALLLVLRALLHQSYTAINLVTEFMFLRLLQRFSMIEAFSSCGKSV